MPKKTAKVFDTALDGACLRFGRCDELLLRLQLLLTLMGLALLLRLAGGLSLGLEESLMLGLRRLP